MTTPDTRPAPQHPVRSTPVTKPVTKARPQLGFLDPETIEHVFMGALYLTMLVLVLLSVFGTFYGLQGEDAPLFDPVRLVLDPIARPWGVVWTIALQGGLTLAQYGTRVMTRHDRRWWLGYLAALGISVYYNLQAYLDPVVALGVPWLLASAIIIAGDVLPEHIAIRHT